MDMNTVPMGWTIDKSAGAIVKVTNPEGKSASVVRKAHPTFIVNTLGATEEDAKALIAHIQNVPKLHLGTAAEALTRAGEKTDYVLKDLVVVEGNNAIVGAPSAGKTPTVHGMLASGFSGVDFLRYGVENEIRKCLYMTAEGEKLHGRALQRYGLGNVLTNLTDVNERYRAAYSERCVSVLKWTQIVEQGTDWLTKDITSGDPVIMVVEIMTDWLTDLGDEGENDATRMTTAMGVIKSARDSGVTPILQLQTPKYYDLQTKDEDTSLAMIRGSGGIGGHLDVVVAYKVPKKSDDRKNTRYFKILRNRFDGVPEDDSLASFYVTRLSDSDYQTVDDAGVEDIYEIVTTSVLAAKHTNNLGAPILSEIQKASGKRHSDIKATVEEMAEDGRLKVGSRKTKGRPATTYAVV